MRRLVPLALLVVLMAGCGVNTSPSGQASTAGAKTEWELRYLLLERYPDFAYCDPDYYPVARVDEQSAADDWWASADRNSPEVIAIVARHGVREPLAPEQRLTAYRDHKKLTVIAMTVVSAGYDYELSTSTAGGHPDEVVSGEVTSAGEIRETSREARPGGCPICLDAATWIATPVGEVRVARIRPGDVVWTVDGAGRKAPATVSQIAHRVTPGPHLMLRLVLSDGRLLIAAGAHPRADGGYLRAVAHRAVLRRRGDRLDRLGLEHSANHIRPPSHGRHRHILGERNPGWQHA